MEAATVELLHDTIEEQSSLARANSDAPLVVLSVTPVTPFDYEDKKAMEYWSLESSPVYGNDPLPRSSFGRLWDYLVSDRTTLLAMLIMALSAFM